MDLILVLITIVVGGTLMAFAIFGQHTISSEKKIFFEVINEMHAGKSIEDIEQRLIKKYKFNQYEAGLIVSAAIEGDSDYVMDYTKELLKKYEEAN